MITTNSKSEMDNNNFENVSLDEDIDHDLNFYGETNFDCVLYTSDSVQMRENTDAILSIYGKIRIRKVRISAYFTQCLAEHFQS